MPKILVVDDEPNIIELSKLYLERFYQVSGVRTGVGLGLAIAREIVLAHGGKIEVKSTPGEETEFIVRLPTRP